jgi:hypothetical protein
VLLAVSWIVVDNRRHFTLKAEYLSIKLVQETLDILLLHGCEANVSVIRRGVESLTGDSRGMSSGRSVLSVNDHSIRASWPRLTTFQVSILMMTFSLCLLHPTSEANSYDIVVDCKLAHVCGSKIAESTFPRYTLRFPTFPTKIQIWQFNSFTLSLSLSPSCRRTLCLQDVISPELPNMETRIAHITAGSSPHVVCSSRDRTTYSPEPPCRF